MTTDCVFCQIVARTGPALIVREDVRTLAFIDVAPATEGHVLVVPKRHSRSLLDIEPADLTATAIAAQEIARLQRERLGCVGVSLYQANEPAGFQTVFHFHVHVVPRYPGDAVTQAWQRHERAPDADLERMARRLRGD